MSDKDPAVSRRKFLRIGAGLAGAAGASALAASLGGSPARAQDGGDDDDGGGSGSGGHNHGTMPGANGEVDHRSNGFNPTDILTDFDGGKVSTLPDGRTQREYTITAGDQSVELLPGLSYHAWTYNGRIPGPTIRAREGDHLLIHFVNGGSHPHTMHFHGIHGGAMDGVFELVQPGGTFDYEFDAIPFGVHLYHCHASPLAEHISRGLYGAFIVEPKDGWSPVDHEYVMVMNGFDVNFDGKNDLYAVNTIPFHFDRHPIQFMVNQKIRIFLVNILEFDPINSFHMHANFFNYFPTGTSRTPSEYTDTIAQMQAQRGILEFSYPLSGRFMFHAHKTEFAELGWTGLFEVME